MNYNSSLPHSTACACGSHERAKTTRWGLIIPHHLPLCRKEVPCLCVASLLHTLCFILHLFGPGKGPFIAVYGDVQSSCLLTWVSEVKSIITLCRGNARHCTHYYLVLIIFCRKSQVERGISTCRRRITHTKHVNFCPYSVRPYSPKKSTSSSWNAVLLLEGGSTP